LILAALAVWLGNIINIALLPLFVWVINRYQIIPEERALAQLFGTDYDAYCSRVRRWL
jgi:protein-S-isoprenylcysteine O-methyltransferase Ste14